MNARRPRCYNESREGGRWGDPTTEDGPESRATTPEPPRPVALSRFTAGPMAGLPIRPVSGRPACLRAARPNTCDHRRRDPCRGGNHCWADAMSDSCLKFIPTDPEWRPAADAAERSRCLLATFVPGAAEVKAQLLDEVTFVDPGSNWSGVECPACGNDASDWWADAMDEAHTRAFAELRTRARCCGAQVSLNEMRYAWPAGFASFILEATNPGIADLEPAQERRLAACLGVGLRKIWAHY